MSNYIVRNGELYHWGIKGQKWGRRRYQNPDGSLTPEGEKRYKRDVQENNAKKKDNRMVIEGPDPDRWVKEDISRTKGLVDKSQSAIKDVERFTDKHFPKSTKETLDLSNMSDQEMRSRINRALLERQYNEMFAPEKKSRGREIVSKTLEVAGSVLTVGSTALAIALSIKELKG